MAEHVLAIFLRGIDNAPAIVRYRRSADELLGIREEVSPL